MASRNSEARSTDLVCKVKIIGDCEYRRDEDDEAVDFLTAISQSFRDCEYKTDCLRTGEDGNIAFAELEIMNRRAAASKAETFRRIRQDWCSVREPGYPFWLEPTENTKSLFGYEAKSDVSTQELKPTTFSLGSFYDRETYISHWSSANDFSISDSDTIEVEFEHHSKIVTIAVSCRGKKFRIEFEYRQLESNVVADENKTDKEIHLYFPLQRPPKVEEVDDKYSRRINQMLGCSRDVLGGSSVLCFQLPLSEVNDDSTIRLLTRLSCKMDFTIYFAAIKTKYPQSLNIPEKPIFESDFKVGYALECLLSRGFKVQDRVTQDFYDILRQRRSEDQKDKICQALYYLTSFVETGRFCPLDKMLHRLLHGDKKQLTLVDFELPQHYVCVPRLIITPTQNYLVPPEPVAKNRVIREFGHQYTMRIAFRDEDFSKLMSGSRDYLTGVLDERVVKLLTAGINLCGRHFDFLACSNSQLRDHGAWLYANNREHTAEEIRDSLGELDQIRCVATYVARMGQCFSSTKESVKVSIDEGCIVEEIPDIKKKYKDVYFSCCDEYRSGTYIFSDGVGKISSALAKKVACRLEIDPVPSAFQIRYGGCKGMLARDPSLPDGDTTEILQYRKSMKKFDSQHSALEICERTRPNVLYLNRQCITLLSGLGVEDEAFIGLQDTMLHHLASMLLFETVAVETLRGTNIAGGLKVSALSRSGVNVTSEPFIRSLLLALYNSRLGDLRRRSRIAIPESYGRLLMGVMDETDTLEYGQIFVRYSKLVSKPGEDVQTLLGSVMVSKNPCFHAGDMRKFKAVDVEALHHLVDCIVFPAKGPRPHPDEMSGSDLDGDEYFVTWHEKLVCEGENKSPMDFMPTEKELLDKAVDVTDMIKFVAKYITNDQLGVIANAHMVHADFEEEGIFSKKCVELAHLHSKAVDFPKTGECPYLPPNLRPDEYPDFMMKKGKPSKRSKRVLGKLFQKCQGLYRYQQFKPETSQSGVKVDKDLIVPGYEKFSENAKENLEKYNSKLLALMNRYGLTNEGEVITGCLMRVDTRLSGKTAEKFEVTQIIHASVSSLRKNAKQEFYSQFGGYGTVMENYSRNRQRFPVDILRKASAWYVSTYERAGQSRAKDPYVTLLSFPWVADRILSHIKKAKQERMETSIEHPLRETSKPVAEQATRFFNGRLKILIDDFNSKVQEKNQFSKMMRGSPSLSLCGESLTGIYAGDDTPTPTQIYVHRDWNATESDQLKFLGRISVVGRTLSQISVELKESPPCIILKKTDGRLKKQWYISADSILMLKSAYISLHVQRCPSMLHALLIIAHWGRMRDLTGKHYGYVNLAVLFLLFCERKEFINEISAVGLRSHAKRLLGLPLAHSHSPPEEMWKESVLVQGNPEDCKGFRNDVNPGIALLKFFEYYSTTSDRGRLGVNNVMYPTAFSQEGRLFPNLTKNKIQRFSDAAMHVLHEIAQCRGLDILMMSTDTNETKEIQETICLPKNTWGAVRFAEEFVGSKLSELTGAQVLIPSVRASSEYTIEVFGNYLALNKVLYELKKFEKTCQSYIFNHEVTGAPRFIFGSQATTDAVVTCNRLPLGNYAMRLKNPCASSSEDKAKFLRAFSRQMSLFQRERSPSLHGGDQLHFRVKFGSVTAVSKGQLKEGERAADDVEKKFEESADPQRKSQQAKKRKQVWETKNGYWHWLEPLPLSSNLWKLGLDELHYRHKLTQESYILQVEEGRNTFRVVFDSDMEFKKLDIPPIRWLQVDVKNPAGLGFHGVDFRLMVSSPRELDSKANGKLVESPSYKRYVRSNVLRKTESGLELDESLVSTTKFVHQETRQIYDLSGFSVAIEAHEVTTIKYIVRAGSATILNKRDSVSFVQFFASLDEAHFEDATTVAQEIWSVTKHLLPYVNLKQASKRVR